MEVLGKDIGNGVISFYSSVSGLYTHRCTSLLTIPAIKNLVIQESNIFSLRFYRSR